jgi:hypothetical protein
MKKTASGISGFILISVLGIFLTGCEVEGGYGTLYVGDINNTNTNIHLMVYIDGKFEGGFVSRAHESGIPDCNNLDPSQENTTILTYLPAGKRKYEVKDSSTEQVLASGTVTIVADGCNTLTLY